MAADCGLYAPEVLGSHRQADKEALKIAYWDICTELVHGEWIDSVFVFWIYLKKFSKKEINKIVHILWFIGL